MPYDNIASLPGYVQGKPEAKQRQWMAVFNSSYDACIKGGGSQSSCESEAFAKANGVVKGAEMDDTPHSHHEGIMQLEKADPRVNFKMAAAGTDKTCGDCRFFDTACMECAIVEGTVSASAYCDLWTEQLPMAPQMPAEMMPQGMAWSEEPYRVFVAQPVIQFAEGTGPDYSVPWWIPFLPKPGSYMSPRYGEVVITPEANKAFVQSVKDHVYQEHIPLDAEHLTKVSGAVGWIQDMRMNDDGSADAYVEWTDRGKTLLAGGQFKYVSPELYDEWPDPASGVVHKNVVVGGAITTRPFFKDKALRALVASETGIEVQALAFRDFTPEQRAGMAKDGMAMPDGSYPIPDVDALERAIKSYGRSPDQATKAHIKKRAAALGKTDLLPKDWSEKENQVADGQEPKTYTTEQVDDKLEAQAKAFTEKMEAQAKDFTDKLAAQSTALEAAQTLAASEKTAREAIAAELITIKTADRAKRFAELVSGRGGSGDGAAWAGDPAAHITMLEKLADQFGEDNEVTTGYIAQQKAIAAQLKESGLFREFGSSATGPEAGSPDDKLEAMAQARMKATPGLTHAKAYTEALNSPEGAKIYQQGQVK